EWERAAWQHAGRPGDAANAQRDLLRYRLQLALAGLDSDPAHLDEALRLRPELPLAPATPGRRLARAGRGEAALPYLARAFAAVPFDPRLSRVLFAVLGRTGRRAEQERLADDRRLLARALPRRVRSEKWFALKEAPGYSVLSTQYSVPRTSSTLAGTPGEHVSL